MAWHQGLKNPIPNFSLSLHNPQKVRDRASHQHHQMTWGQIKALSSQSTQLLEQQGLEKTPENFLLAAFSCLNANSLTIVMCIFLSCILPPAMAISEQGLWQSNMYITDAQNLSQLLNQTDCWVCMHMPTHTRGGLLMHAVPFNLSGWTTYPWDNGVFINSPVNYTVRHLGSRIQENATFCWEYNNDSITGPRVGKYPYCNQTFTLQHNMSRNNTFLNETIAEHMHNFTKYMCNYQLTGCPVGQGCPTSTATGGFNLCNPIAEMVKQTQNKQNTSTNLLGNIWMLCGCRAYMRIPARWTGRCTLDYIMPSFYTTTKLPKGRIRNRRESVQNPIGQGTGTMVYRGLFPPLGAALNHRHLRTLANWTTALFNLTIKSIKLLTEEISQMREIVLQNR
ncbi:uncharacterized protein LOC115094354 [Rhinatrema bivittatum]|uniref:uncharacterized protein LOC115094354 n=1 Tax=Rhinatrema bivittatum TaxID=194408 RepID=UPI00112BF862|nr:uncharacterized protein LOC115094354 [Rhinatrema bivittatum]